MPSEGADPWAAFSGGRIGGGRGGEDEKQAFIHFNRAKDLFSRGQLSAAVEEAHAASRLQPSNPRPYALAAAALNRLKRFDEAEAEARKAVSIKKDNADAYQAMAFAQLSQERFSEAVLSASEAIEHAPRSAQAHALRAFAYEQLNEDALKMADIERAAALDPRAYESYLTTARKGGILFRAPGSAPSRVSGDLFSHPLALPGLLLLATLILGLSAYFFLSRAPIPIEAAAARPPPVETDEKGLLSGKYELTRVIGKGGMGHVWAAKDHSLNRVVAVKKMSAEMGALGSAARGYYVQEARTVASLHHPHIISIYEILDLPSGVYLVFEMASGKTVQHLLAEKKRLPLARVREIFRPVCDALEFAHGRGFVHRDLKPANIMLTEQGFVKVMDFGIARRVGSRAEAADHSPVPDLKGMPVDKTTTIVGTPAYMAPESERGIVTSVSDVFSLGVCFYEMLAGKQPFSSKDKPAKLERRYARLSELAPELPPEADALAHEAMDPDPETRVPSAREFLNRLEKLSAR